MRLWRVDGRITIIECMETHLHHPPAGAVLAARRGLELRSAFRRGGTHVGLARGIRMAEGVPLDLAEIRIVSAWFARHGANRRSVRRIWGDEVDPSAAWIAWLLWGGDDARAWADALVGRRMRTASIADELGRLCL